MELIGPNSAAGAPKASDTTMMLALCTKFWVWLVLRRTHWFDITKSERQVYLTWYHRPEMGWRFLSSLSQGWCLSDHCTGAGNKESLIWPSPGAWHRLPSRVFRKNRLRASEDARGTQMSSWGLCSSGKEMPVFHSEIRASEYWGAELSSSVGLSCWDLRQRPAS